MRLMNAKLSRNPTRAMLYGGLAALVATVTLCFTSVASANPAATGPNRPCTIDAELNVVNVQLDRSVPPGQMIADAHRSLQNAHPGASVVEQMVGRAHSAQLPIVENRNVVILRVEGEEDRPIGGPVDTSHSVVMGRVSCAVAVYDSDTGEFLVEWQSLTPRQ